VSHGASRFACACRSVYVVCVYACACVWGEVGVTWGASQLAYFYHSVCTWCICVCVCGVGSLSRCVYVCVGEYVCRCREGCFTNCVCAS